MKWRKLGAVCMAALMATGLLAGCGSTEGGSSQSSQTSESGSTAGSSSADTSGSSAGNTASDTVYQIGVLQLVQHDALDLANQGFFKALDDLGIQYEADQQNASGEQSNCQTIAAGFVNDGVDMIFAIGTQAAQSAAGATSDIPIVLTAVTDPESSGLVESNDAPGGNVTGTSDMNPVTEQIALVKQLAPEAQTVGILYNSAESNSEIQAAMAEEACAAEGLSSERLTISSTNEIQSVVSAAAGKVDVIYAPTDNMIASTMATVAMVANENGIPTIVGEPGMVQNGGLATYGIDYEMLGYQAGEMAAKILTGESSPADMPIEYQDASRCVFQVNVDTAEALGIDVSGLDAEQVHTAGNADTAE